MVNQITGLSIDMKYLLYYMSIFSLRRIIVTACSDPHKLTAVSDEVIALALYQRIRNEGESENSLSI